jgi:alkylation response protein AidB-like acyl-CoA dehydrogenase
MDFAFSEEQELLRRTARDFLGEHAPMRRVREVMEGEGSVAPELWKQMVELGWLGLALPERAGGSGLSLVELSIVLEELGRCLAPVPFLPTSIAAAAIDVAGDEVQRAAWLPRIARGEVAASFAITEDAGSDEPADLQLRAEADGDGFALTGRKLFVPEADAADLLVVVARTGDEAGRGLALFLVPRNAEGVVVESMRAMDPLRPLHRVDLDGVRVARDDLLAHADDAWPVIERVLDRARVMVCAEMVGGAQKCLEDAVRYAKQRIQFGKPIGANQAIKHKCADMLLQVESARSLTYHAAWAASEASAEAALAVSMAKAYASDAYRRVAAENIQIHGGVGFTWEYDCHLYFKRAKSDEVWLGDGARHRERVARLLEI